MNSQNSNQKSSGYSDLTWTETISLATISVVPSILFLVKCHIEKYCNFRLGAVSRYLIFAVIISVLNLFTHNAMMGYVEIPMLELDILQRKSASFIDTI